MRLIFLLIALTATAAWSQALTEAAAAAAGGSVGGVAGKKVGEGVGTIFQKVAASTEKAATAGTEAKAPPALEVGAGVPKAGPPKAAPPRADRSLVPPPPPPPVRKAVVKAEPLPAPQPVIVITAPAPPPPPPEVTADDLRTLTNGMGRLEVLKLGPPASRVTMVETGHLLEIYRYANRDKSLGVVRLNDGVVSSIEVRP
jgi:hypothetical protein